MHHLFECQTICPCLEVFCHYFCEDVLFFNDVYTIFGFLVDSYPSYIFLPCFVLQLLGWIFSWSFTVFKISSFSWSLTATLTTRYDVLSVLSLSLLHILLMELVITWICVWFCFMTSISFLGWTFMISTIFLRLASVFICLFVFCLCALWFWGNVFIWLSFPF